MEDEKKNQNADTQTATENKAQENQELKTENKNEGEKTKKQVAQKGEDGSIVFKNQDELDGFIRRMYAKGAEKAEQGETSKQVQENQMQQEEVKQEESVAAVDYTDKIALAMAKVGVDVKKVERAARLVDTSKILENGVLDSKKLEDEINAVIAEFPEFRKKKKKKALSLEQQKVIQIQAKKQKNLYQVKNGIGLIH
mgnify:CR=1 FL=1